MDIQSKLCQGLQAGLVQLDLFLVFWIYVHGRQKMKGIEAERIERSGCIDDFVLEYPFDPLSFLINKAFN